jgi:ATP-dependent Clp protease ATP-binding subunit ClpA
MQRALRLLLVSLAITGCARAGDKDRSREAGDRLGGIQGYTLAPDAVEAIAAARRFAAEKGSGLVTPGLLALGVLADDTGTAREVARARKVDLVALTAALHALPSGPPRDATLGDRAPYSAAAQKALGRAMDHAAALEHPSLLGADILFGISADGEEPAARTLAAAGLDSGAITAAAIRQLPTPPPS